MTPKVIKPSKPEGKCKRCRQVRPVRVFETTVDGRSILRKELCDDCWPLVSRTVIDMIL